MKLHIKGGRVVDPASGRDAIGDVFVSDGRISDGFQKADRRATSRSNAHSVFERSGCWFVRRKPVHPTSRSFCSDSIRIENALAVTVATNRTAHLEQISVPDPVAAAAPMAGGLALGQAQLLGQAAEPQLPEGSIAPRRLRAGLRKADDFSLWVIAVRITVIRHETPQ